MFCRNCGNKLDAGDAFCANCGSRIISANAGNQQNSVQAPQPVEPVQIPVQQSVEPVQAPQPVEPVQIPVQQPIESIQEPIKAEIVEEKKKSATKKPDSTGKKILRGILSTVISILVYVITVMLMLTISIRSWINPANLEKAVGEVDSVKLAELIVEENEVYESMSEEKRQEACKEIASVIEKSSVSDIFTDVIYDYAEYILDGDIPERVTAEKIIDKVREEEDELEKILGYEMDETDYEELEAYLAENEDVLDSVNDLSRGNPIINVLKAMSSKVTIILLAVLDVLLLAWLFVVRKWKLNALMWFGIPALLASLEFISMAVVPVESVIPDARIGELVGQFTNSIMATTLKQGIIGSVAAIVLIVISIVSSVISKKRRTKDA